MIIYRYGDIFESKAEVITITVNCVGVMGKGIALQCKNRFKKSYHYYKDMCNTGKIQPGKPILINQERKLLLFPTKNHWRNPSKLEWITEGVKRIANNEDKFTSIAIPPLGCGNGGLDWKMVLQILVENLEKIKPNVEIYAKKRINK